MKSIASIDPSCIKKLESTYFNSTVPKISVGDTLKIGVSITEGNKERIQFSEGVVIGKSNAGINTVPTYPPPPKTTTVPLIIKLTSIQVWISHVF